MNKKYTKNQSHQAMSEVRKLPHLAEEQTNQRAESVDARTDSQMRHRNLWFGNKRGWIGILTVIMLGVIISIVIYSYVRPWEVEEVMGEQQAAILNAYSVGEQARVYISDAAELAAQQALTGKDLSDAEQLQNFKDEFLFYFEQYLDSYELPSYEEDDIYTLYDVVNYDLRISAEEDKVTIIGYPVIDKDTRVEYDEEGELVDVEYEYESAIEIGSETYNFDYILDPYFRIELDI